MNSRNRRAGILIGQGKSVREALDGAGGVVEGWYAAESIWQMARREGVEMPICQSAYQVLYEGRDPRGVAKDLMGRARKDELLDVSWV